MNKSKWKKTLSAETTPWFRHRAHFGVLWYLSAADLMMNDGGAGEVAVAECAECPLPGGGEAMEWWSRWSLTEVESDLSLPKLAAHVKFMVSYSFDDFVTQNITQWCWHQIHVSFMPYKCISLYSYMIFWCAANGKTYWRICAQQNLFIGYFGMDQ